MSRHVQSLIARRTATICVIIAMLSALAVPALAATATSHTAQLVSTPDGLIVVRDTATADFPDVLLRLDASADPYRVHQWGLDAIQDSARLSGERGDGVVIAIVDSGVEATHPDLAHAMVGGWAIANGNPNVDALGHGTNVAGVIAARSGDGYGIGGVADGVSIMPIKVVADDGSAWASDVAEGIIHAVDAGADLINVSLTTEVDVPVLRGAITYAAAADVPVIASAGNRMREGNPVMYPAAYADVLGVAAIDRNLDSPGFASAGAWVEIAAPGVGVFTTAPGGGFEVVDGGSYASPHVAAAAAVLIGLSRSDVSVRQVLSRQAAVEQLLDTAKDIGPSGRDDETGHGLVDLASALAALGPREVAANTPALRAAQLSAAAVGMGRASHAVVISSSAWADGLAAAGLAGLGAPILLADETLPQVTAAELVRAVEPGGTVFVLGGQAGLPAEVERQITDLGFTAQRISGPSRVETAVQAASVASSGGLIDDDTILLASASGWADAVAGGSLAAALGAPVLLTDGASLHPAVAAYLQQVNPRKVILLGGSAVLSAALLDQVGGVTDASVSRLAGSNRQATALVIAQQQGDRPTGVTLIDGFADDGWVDGLAAAPLGLPVLMADASGSLDGGSSGWLRGIVHPRLVNAFR